MHISVEQRYPASVAEVGRMLATEAFVRWRAGRVGNGLDQQIQADVTGTADGAFAVVVRRSLPGDQIPANVRSFVGGKVEIRQAEAWEAETDGFRTGTISLEVIGAPVRLAGTMTLHPADGGSALNYVGDIRAMVPLFGGPIENAVAAAVRQVLAAEEAAGREWLAAG